MQSFVVKNTYVSIAIKNPQSLDLQDFAANVGLGGLEPLTSTMSTWQNMN